MYGPLSLGGANFRSLYVEQGIGQLSLFLKHWRLQTTTGTLLRIAISWFQLAIGISSPILEKPGITLPQLESKWIGSLRSFLAHYDMAIHLDESMVPPVQRVHDAYIMDVVLQSQLFTAAEIQRINYCRLFLQAVTISDLAKTDGVTLDRSKLCGHPSLMSSTTTFLHIHQGRPSEAEWQLWRKVNRLWSTEDGRFHQPLGPWLLSIHKQRASHFAYMFLNRMVVIRTTDNYLVCQPIDSTTYKETFYQIPFQSIPEKAVPITVRPSIHTTHWNLQAKTTIMQQLDPQFVSHSATFEDYMRSPEPCEYDLLTHTDLMLDPYATCHALVHGIRAVSDGSVHHDNHGAFAWTLSSDRGERLAFGKGPVRGLNLTPFRAEGVGLLSLLRFLIRIAEYTMMHEPWQGIVATDSKSLLDTLVGKADSSTYQQAHSNLPVLDLLQADWDILVEICHALEKLPGLTFQHIKGHQDRKTQYSRLSLLAQLNVDADRLASDYQEEYGSARPQVLMTPRTRAHVLTTQGTVTSNYATSVRHLAGQKPLRQYIQARHQWSDHTMQSVN